MSNVPINTTTAPKKPGKLAMTFAVLTLGAVTVLAVSGIAWVVVSLWRSILGGC